MHEPEKTFDRVRKHIEAKINTGQIQISPFPHLIIENFFPDDVFATIMAYNPFKRNVGEEWLSKSFSANVSSQTPYLRCAPIFGQLIKV